MGTYNPNIPQILGQEWVGIRDENQAFSPAVNFQEVGHQFTTAASYTLGDARFYINTFPTGRSLGQVFLATIYRAGYEDQTGPVRSVVIPCNAVLVSGGAVGDVLGVKDPSDNVYVFFPDVTSLPVPFARFYFAVNQYSQMLMGKRILGVNFLYNMASRAVFLGPPPPESLWGTFSLEDGTGSSIVGLGAAQTQGSIVGIADLSVARAGEIDHFWSVSAPNGIPDRYPYNYQGLQKFEISHANRVGFTYTHPLDSGEDAYLSYVAMEVVFCEENRLYYGGKAFGSSGFASSSQIYNMGVNGVTMRDTTYTASPVLAPGTYSLVISSADLGDCAGAAGLTKRQIVLSQYPLLNALRQLYEISPHPGVQVNVTQTVDETFTSESTDVLPQLSLHTSSAPLTEVHAYGRQAAAQVYGSITATQEILDTYVGGTYQYAQVRFFARRFGDTTVPLTLDSPTIVGSSVSITPDDFDALDEIVDGWREVTLEFNTPPTMGAGTNPQWRWSATGELPGDRWEVLGVIAPAVSGVAGNLLNQVAPSTQRLGVATYGTPVSGSGINLGWIPGYTPLVSSTTDDPSADAALMFSINPPTITGFSVTEQDFTVTGIGLECGVDPCCIPTEIQYHEITWTAPPMFSAGSQLHLPGGTGNYASTPDTAVLDIVGDIDIRADVKLSNWVPGAAVALVAKYDSTGSQRSYNLTLSSTGTLQMLWSTAGSANIIKDSTANPVPAADGRLAVRATLDVDNGAAGNTVTFYTAPTIDGPWTQLGAPVVTAGVTSIFAGTADLYVGARNLGVSDIMSGEVFAAEVYNGIAGSVVANPDFSAQAPGTTSFVDAAGRTWTLSGTASIQAVPVPAFGHYEIQRMDTVDTDWKTIMLSSTVTLTGFNDYEARVGIESSYRLRVLNIYDFAGPWSATVTNTLSEPGVTIGCGGGHLLIFTSNEEQDGSINLAYSSVWEAGQTVDESFAFPEAGFVQLQAMYNRDFFIAFRPTERGGERFQRTVLVQAAAIAPETLADFTSLRDMAWANVSYICVRDEGGNRWFATVLVPGGRVLRDRRLYLAPVDIIEVTDIPSQVDP